MKTTWTDKNPPKVYLSYGINDENRETWMLIYQGVPLCNYKFTRAEAEAAARQMKVSPEAIWDSVAGQFQPLTERVST